MLLAAALALPAASPVLSCPFQESGVLTAGEGKQPENRGTRDRCKKAEESRANAPKGCPDGGERLPQDKQHSPLDDTPPLAPLVA